jgi:MFS family permease
MTDKPRLFYGYIIVIVSFLIMMLILGLHPSFGIFFKPITEEMGWSRTVTSVAFSISIFMGGVTGIIMGGLNDRFGPRIVITCCSLLCAIGYLMVWQVQTPWQFYLSFGVIVGAGSMIYVPVMSTVARWFTKRRSMMTGIVFMGSGIGMMVMPLVINLLISANGWRTAVLILGLLIVAVCVLAAQFLKRDPSHTGQAAQGDNKAGEATAHSDMKNYSPREAVRTRQFWLFIMALFLYGFSFFSVQVHIAAHVTDLGFTATDAAAILSILGGSTIVGQLVLGSAGDRIGYKKAFLIGLILLTLGFFVLMIAREMWGLYIFAILVGMAFGDCGTQESTLVAWLFGLSSHGLLLGFAVFSWTMGAAVGPIISGYIFDATGSYQPAFYMFVGLAIIAVILTMLIRQPEHHPGAPPAP